MPIGKNQAIKDIIFKNIIVSKAIQVLVFRRDTQEFLAIAQNTRELSLEEANTKNNKYPHISYFHS